MAEKEDHCFRKLVDVANMLDSVSPFFVPTQVDIFPLLSFARSRNCIMEPMLWPLANLKPIAVELVRLVSAFSLWNVL